MTASDRRGHRPPPDRHRGPSPRLEGPARRLVDRVGRVDRSARFRTRLADVHAARERHERITHRLMAVTWTAVAAALVLAGVALLDLAGALIGLGTAASLFVIVRAVAWRATRRGAPAWDWEAGRYRLYGRPADRVQMLDRPPDARIAEDPMGTGFERFLRRRS